MSFQSKPAWAGDDFLSRCVNLLIQTKPVYAVMKQQARQVLIKTAQKNGIPYQDTFLLQTWPVSDSRYRLCTQLSLFDNSRTDFYARSNPRFGKLWNRT